MAPPTFPLPVHPSLFPWLRSFSRASTCEGTLARRAMECYVLLRTALPPNTPESCSYPGARAQILKPAWRL